MKEMTSVGTASASAVQRTHGRRQTAAMRIVMSATFESDGNNPVIPQIERQFFVESFDERRSVLVQKGDEANRPFLRVPVGEGERARVNELPAQRFVAALRSLNQLAVERLQIVLHAPERRARRALERRIECGNRGDEAIHLRLDRTR